MIRPASCLRPSTPPSRRAVALYRRSGNEPRPSLALIAPPRWRPRTQEAGLPSTADDRWCRCAQRGGPISDCVRPPFSVRRGDGAQTAVLHSPESGSMSASNEAQLRTEESPYCSDALRAIADMGFRQLRMREGTTGSSLAGGQASVPDGAGDEAVAEGDETLASVGSAEVTGGRVRRYRRGVASRARRDKCFDDGEAFFVRCSYDSRDRQVEVRAQLVGRRVGRIVSIDLIA